MRTDAACFELFARALPRTAFWAKTTGMSSQRTVKNLRNLMEIVLALIAVSPWHACAQVSTVASSPFQAVPELPYRVLTNFFKFPKDMIAGEASAVAVNAKGHIFLFQRTKPMLAEYDEKGNFVQSIGEGLFSHPHGLRIDADGNLWTTDDGSHLVLKLDPSGTVLLVLGRINTGAEADWLLNKPADVAFAKNGDVFVADGYGNSRVVKFDRDGNYLKSWGKYGTAIGEFNLPHTVAVDEAGRVYVGDRENQRIQIFDSEGNFLKQWTGIGYPYGLVITPDQHVWMADGGYDRIIELDQSGKILGAFGEPGHKPGQMAWAHFLAIGPNQAIYVAVTYSRPSDRISLPSGRASAAAWFARTKRLPSSPYGGCCANGT